MVTILMMSAKMAMVGLLKMNLFWNNSYDVIILFHGVTNKILSCDSNYIVDVGMWPKFLTLSFLWEKLTTILLEFDQKNDFLWMVVLVHVE